MVASHEHKMYKPLVTNGVTSQVSSCDQSIYGFGVKVALGRWDATTRDT
jgi:hypothetical protein